MLEDGIVNTRTIIGVMGRDRLVEGRRTVFRFLNRRHREWGVVELTPEAAAEAGIPRMIPVPKSEQGRIRVTGIPRDKISRWSAEFIEDHQDLEFVPALRQFLKWEPPGVKWAWHTLVEEYLVDDGVFIADMVFNTDSIVGIPEPLSKAITEFYSGVYPSITGSSLTIRQWLREKDYQFHLQFGREALDKVKDGTWPPDPP